MRKLSLFLLLIASAQSTPAKIESTVTLAAATATPMTMISGFAGYQVCLASTEGASIFYGFTPAVTGSTGFEVTPGQCKAVNLTYQSSSTGTVVYLYSVAGTGSGKVLWKGVR